MQPTLEIKTAVSLIQSCPACGGAGYVPLYGDATWLWSSSTLVAVADRTCRRCGGAGIVAVPLQPSTTNAAVL